MTSVLIVDDSRFARLTLRSLIAARHPDWSVTEAADGAEALAALSNAAAAYVLLDYNMPGDDGLVVAGKIRATGSAARIAILTANVQDALSERVRQHGLHFMKKPAKDADVTAFLALG